MAVAWALAWSAPAAAQSTAGRGDENERITIESANTEVQELIRLSKTVGRAPGDLHNTIVMRDKQTARWAVADFITRANASPRLMAARAIALIAQIRGDPRVRTRARLLELASMISTVVAQSVNSPRVVEVRVHDDYLPPANAKAFDLGPLESPVAVGFEPLTPGSDIVSGQREAAYAEARASALLADGIANVQRVEMRLENGSYRVILLTARPLSGNLPAAPFGNVLVANSTPYHLGEALPRSWISGAQIVRPAFARDNLPATIGLDRLERMLREAPLRAPGGMAVGMAFKVDVVHGYMVLRFEQPRPGDGVRLAGIVVEPTGQASSLVQGREILRGSIGRHLAKAVSAKYDSDPDMVAALTAIAVNRTPAYASDIVTSSVRVNPNAAKRVVEVVSRMPGVNARAIQTAIQHDPVLSRDAKVAALAALPAAAP